MPLKKFIVSGAVVNYSPSTKHICYDVLVFGVPQGSCVCCNRLPLGVIMHKKKSNHFCCPCAYMYMVIIDGYNKD